MLVCGRTLAKELEDEFDNFFAHYQCAAHVLNLAVQEGLQQDIYDIIVLLELIKWATLFLSTSKYPTQEEQEQVKATILELTSYCGSSPYNMDESINDDNIDVRNYFRQLRQRNSSINTHSGSVVLSNHNTGITTTSNNNSANEQQLIMSELTRYLSAPLEDKVDPLLWWYTNSQKNVYPILSLMAQDYLSVQATIVASEQTFSIAGQVITSQRNRLDPDTARATLCLRSWILNN
ncbi:5999_t:CDS:2, partial [Paraglomus occultum]